METERVLHQMAVMERQLEAEEARLRRDQEDRMLEAGDFSTILRMNIEAQD